MSKLDSETIRKYALAAYQGTKHCYQYLQDHVISVLQSLLTRTEYEESLVGTYYRSHLLMRSLVRLDHFDDFQAARSLARSMFELLLDMRSLQRDPALSKRYSSFPKIERMRTAIRIADFVAAHSSTGRNTKYPGRGMVSDFVLGFYVLASKPKTKPDPALRALR